MATQQVAGAGGTTTSFSNTPQAQNDVFNYTEDTVVIVSPSQSIILLDVLANDLGGNAKTLYSIDDGQSASTSTKQYAPIDLTTQDVQASGISAWESIADGVLIRINNGKVEMDLSAYLTAHGFSSLQALGENDHINETFTYAIKLGNGTLSWASVSVNIQGSNDGATITAAPVVDNAVVEAGGVANGTPGDPNASGQLIVSDVDAGQNHFQAPANLNGTYGTFTFDAATGAWTYALNQALADPLTQGQHVTDTLTVTSADGTANYNIVVNIIGTNDAAVLSSASVGLTEGDTAAAISTSGQLTISDVDSDPHFVAQAGTAGSYGSFSIDADGAWTYTASSAHDEFIAGQHYTESFDVVSADGTHTSVAIDILGTNDAAVLSSASVGLTEADTAAAISTSGQLTISDVDSDPHFVAQAGTAGSYGSFSIDADGNWSYTASSAHDEFVAGQHYTESFDVVSADGTHTSVAIDILGTNDAAVLSSASVGLTEGDTAAAISTSGQLTISDVDSDPHFVAQTDTAGSYGSFSIDADGNWSYTASSAHDEFIAGQHYTESFDVVSADGTHTSVAIDILGTNDAAVLSSASVGLTEADTAAAISTSGQLTISDVDSDPHFVAQAGTAGSYGSFSVDADGNWSYTASSAHDEFAAGQHYTDTFDVVSADGTHTSVAIDILGTNDAAVLSSASVGLTEADTAATISTSGQLTISDVDSDPHFVAQAGTAGSYGSFSIDADGAWTYTASSAHDEFVAGQHYTDTFDVVSADGTHSSVAIDILGTNDAAVLSSASVGLTEADTAAAISTSGQLTISDVDSDPHFVAQAGTAGSYGSFSIDADGNWSYTASSAHDEFIASQHYTESFDVVSADGTHTSVAIDILGTNDAAVLSSASVGLTEADTAAAISTSGQLTISDVDSDPHFVAQAGTAGSYGSFSIDADGNWSYTASSAHDEFVAGQHYTESFDVVSADGTHTSVAIDILGTNDAAVLSSASVGLTEGDTAAAISTSGTLTISDVDSDPHFVAQAGTAGSYGTFAIDAAGAWTYTASSAHDEFVAGQHYTDSFDVVSADGTHTSVAIDILGTDDGPPRFAPTDIQLTPSTTTDNVNFSSFQFTGTLAATDPDPGSFVYSITSQSDAGVFSISGSTLSSGDLSPSKAYSITVQATQAGDPVGPAYQYSETFQVITGSNGNSSDGLNGANGGDDVLYGNGGADQIFGLAGNDTLFGQGGNDTLNGGDGNDRLVGGVGADTLTGGAGADTFYYGPNVSDSAPGAGNFDTITDFVHGVDKIDLSSIDANTVSGGDQAFLFGGQNAATVANSITWSEVGGNTIVHVDVNGNATADFQITLTGTGLGLTASDFVL
ncbi:VCBS domain-containing protein [Mesorhizobium sp. WSM4904]|uniref:beta strand repeat-containing protein n=1 Tax=Mesorhizobium sp. WSM4904 TaxID=3038545 RepID=UPI0024185796|nr:VCBS domain-containing protein [Mesorhizobium sp. WSM4904]WFP61361.1 VCBS domain-containing protein [Mesorhizobium sp. WSM4904]